MKLPSISAVMVTCNVQRFLAEAIESILGQTFRDFEFIIVDFGSTDDSRSIISSYAAKDSRIKFHEITRCGLATARTELSLLRKDDILLLWMPMMCLSQIVSPGSSNSWRSTHKSLSWAASRNP